MPPVTAPCPLPAKPRPASHADLFWSLSWLALQGFGGVLAVVQRELVERKKWLTPEEFVEEWAVAQVMPGPNVINLALVMGDRYFGLTGALVALLGLLTFPLMIVLLLAAAFASVADTAAAQGALRGMGTVAAGLIVATGLKLIPTLRKNVFGLPANAAFALLTFASIAWLRFPLAWVLLGLGGAASLLAYHLLGMLTSERQ